MKKPNSLLRFGVPLGAALVMFSTVPTVPGSYQLYGETLVQLRLPEDLCTIEPPFELELIERLGER
ncbi:MAG: hypothetical protein AAGB18_07615, partial [Pseudomonadota bacterium]